jgi:hypothetical protein
MWKVLTMNCTIKINEEAIQIAKDLSKLGYTYIE